MLYSFYIFFIFLYLFFLLSRYQIFQALYQYICAVCIVDQRIYFQQELEVLFFRTSFVRSSFWAEIMLNCWHFHFTWLHHRLKLVFIYMDLFFLQNLAHSHETCWSEFWARFKSGCSHCDHSLSIKLTPK